MIKQNDPSEALIWGGIGYACFLYIGVWAGFAAHLFWIGGGVNDGSLLFLSLLPPTWGLYLIGPLAAVVSIVATIAWREWPLLLLSCLAIAWGLLPMAASLWAAYAIVTTGLSLWRVGRFIGIGERAGPPLSIR